MSRMSEMHDDLSAIYGIIIGELQVALAAQGAAMRMEDTLSANKWSIKVNTLQSLLDSFEAHGVTFPKE